ncbi:class II fructose-bisphosphate aldolase [Isoptericola sp. b441]|uniref:Class II fructose-bisphosphate aldolase n=1 Tax=Actinotalea lenta TaxID=3064654 RepID=A0ABT9DC35_9CELL|nr:MULTISPECIES: class II fructose-bisphosphate aldolase [unclassified Isoptericola]MDO8108449.1 class II fructose-bisphosphate aldolase [Isoptericola sp. b441]MDO8119868.1 class II fructose-bisphosphate aldolase [Isoptericola sp. b490]
MITSTARLARRAREGGYAVAAVNILDDLSLRAVVAAATERSSPVIVQVSVKTVRSIGVELLTTMVRLAAQDAPVPVALHLDHCPHRDVISQVVAAGWSSVLFDASDRDLATAERETAEVVAEAHAAGVDVESEIENIVGVEDDIGSDEAVHAYSVATLVEVATRTGVDLLAPQLGTAHGLYTRSPVLLPERVRELTGLTDLPIVLHGGTGLTDEAFRAFIEAGVSKINISTGLKLAYMKSAQAHTAKAEQTGRWDPPSMFRDISDAVQAEVAGHLDRFGSTGHAQDAAR